MVLNELEDQDWFPPLLRKYQMEYIGMIVKLFGTYRNLVPIIKSKLLKNNCLTIVDLCSGSGLPAIYMHKKLKLKGLSSFLTDKYPQNIIDIEGVQYLKQPLELNQIIPQNDRFYTIYNAWHHFELTEQENLIQKIIKNKSSLFIVEILTPTIFSFIMVTLSSTFGVLLTCPFIKPFEWKRIILTYVLPVNILTVLIDGYISILKSKSKKTYEKELKLLNINQDFVTIESNFHFPIWITTIFITKNDN